MITFRWTVLLDNSAGDRHHVSDLPNICSGPCSGHRIATRPIGNAVLEMVVKFQRFCKKEVGQTGPFEFS
jgi:hypothetical protein